MTVLAPILALALAAGPSDAPRRTADAGTNATRARAGLLPRKAARTHVEVRRLRTVSAPAPTFLGAPAPLADAAPDGAAAEQEGAAPEQDGWEPIASASRDARVEVRPVAAAAEPEPRLAARSRIETVRLRASEPAYLAVPEPAAEPPRVVAPEELGAIRVALLGVSTEVTLRLRLSDP